MLPMTMAIAAASQSNKIAEASLETSPSDATADCAGSEDKPEKPVKGCDLSAACGVKCFGSIGTMASMQLIHMLIGNDLSLPVSEAVRSETSSPPFRPPRI